MSEENLSNYTLKKNIFVILNRSLEEEVMMKTCNNVKCAILVRIIDL